MTAAGGRCAIVTGGAYGIGRATVRLLADDGWAVTVLDRDAERVSETCRLLEAKGRVVNGIVGDVTKADVLAAAVESSRRFGPLKALATCAAMRHSGPITAITERQWKETLDVVLNGVFLACKAVIPEMIAGGGGAIVNVSSPDCYGRLNMVAYAAAKAAVNTLSQCLAADHLSDGVRVNVVLPGFTRTGMTEHYSHERIKEIASRSVAHRVAEPEDTARLIRFLLSDDGETFTGGLFGPQMLATR